MRMNRERLQIGAYCLAPYAHTMEHVREIAECGIDMMLCVPNDRALLDKLADQGVGTVVSGAAPGWFGGQGEQAGQMAIQNRLCVKCRGEKRKITKFSCGNERSSGIQRKSF